MKLIRFSIDLLKREKRSSLMYLFSLVLSTTAIHALICIYLDKSFFSTAFDYNIGLLGTSYVVMWLSLFAIVLLAIYAHNYFLSEKYKIMAVMRLGGSSFKQVLTLVLSQTFALLLVGLPIGMLLGTVVYLLMHYLFAMGVAVTIPVSLSIEAFVFSAIILLVLIIYLALVTVGFVHRHEITELLAYDESMDRSNPDQKMFNFTIPGIIHILLIAGTIYLIITSTSDPTVAFGLGMLSLLFLMDGAIKKSLSSFIRKLRKKVFISNKEMLVSLGFLNLSVLRVNTLTRLLGGVVLFVTNYLCRYQNSRADFIYFYLLFLIFVVLISLAILYQLLMDINNRKDAFKQLYRIGYTKKEIRSAIRKELIMLLCVIGIISYLYTGLSFASYLINALIPVSLAIQLTAIYLGALVIVGVITYKLYISTIMNAMKEVN